MFSMCSELTPRAPIPDGRMERIMQPCPFTTLVDMGVLQIHNLRSDFSNEDLIGKWRSVGSKEESRHRAPIYIEIICVVLIGTLSSLKILSQRESFRETHT